MNLTLALCRTPATLSGHRKEDLATVPKRSESHRYEP